MAAPKTRKKSKVSKASPLTGERRARIVLAALDAFIANGIAPTTLRDVAKRAQVDPPLIHYYFKNIESLHLAVITLALEDLRHYSLRESERWADQPEKWMAEYLKAPLNWIRDRPDWMFLWVYFYTLASRPGSFREMNQQIRKIGRKRITMKVFEGIEKGVFKLEPRMSSGDAALEIQTWMTGSALMFASENEIGYERTARTLHFRIFTLLGCPV